MAYDDGLRAAQTARKQEFEREFTETELEKLNSQLMPLMRRSKYTGKFVLQQKEKLKYMESEGAIKILHNGSFAVVLTPTEVDENGKIKKYVTPTHYEMLEKMISQWAWWRLKKHKVERDRSINKSYEKLLEGVRIKE